MAIATPAPVGPDDVTPLATSFRKNPSRAPVGFEEWLDTIDRWFVILTLISARMANAPQKGPSLEELNPRKTT
jgi:hypothetical protein